MLTIITVITVLARVQGSQVQGPVHFTNSYGHLGIYTELVCYEHGRFFSFHLHLKVHISQ